jgi:hypothetical protein
MFGYGQGCSEYGHRGNVGSPSSSNYVDDKSPLRDTFAVEHLLAGTSMQDLSKMLSHKTVRVTEKYYAPWFRRGRLNWKRR